MKNFLLLLAGVALIACNVLATQKTTFTIREVRNPPELQAALIANSTDSETRMAATEAKVTYSEGSFAVVGTTQLVFIATSTNGVTITPSVTNVIDADITSA